MAQPHYECSTWPVALKGDPIILTPINKGIVTWSGGDKPPSEQTQYSVKNNIFTAEFGKLAGTDSYLLYIIDQVNGKGFAVVHVPDAPVTSVRLTCERLK